MSSAAENTPVQRGEAEPLYTHHERTFQTFRFVYPVLSRRARVVAWCEFES